MRDVGAESRVTATMRSLIAVFPTITKRITPVTLKWTIHKRLPTETKRTDVNIVRMRRTEEGEDDHVAFPLNLPYFLHRRRAHGIDFFLNELPQVIVENDTPAVVGRPVESHGIEHAVGTIPEMQQNPGLRKVLRSY